MPGPITVAVRIDGDEGEVLLPEIEEQGQGRVKVHRTESMPESGADDSASRRLLFSREGTFIPRERWETESHAVVVDVVPPPHLEMSEGSMILGPGSQHETFRSMVAAVLHFLGCEMPLAEVVDAAVADDAPAAGGAGAAVADDAAITNGAAAADESSVEGEKPEDEYGREDEEPQTESFPIVTPGKTVHRADRSISHKNAPHKNKDKGVSASISDSEGIGSRRSSGNGSSGDKSTDAGKGKGSASGGGKARHRWMKELAAIGFSVSVKGAKANVVWRKRNEMVVKAGARLMKEPPLNKDGSLGYDARFGQAIRDEHRDKIKDFKTTEDIVLKSPNEVGLFLYFGGRNGWMELMDAGGRTLDEWTRVEPQTR